MPKLRLTKGSLKECRDRQRLYERLLPSLDLKRRQLTVELQRARRRKQDLARELDRLEHDVGEELPMLADLEIDLAGLVALEEVRVGHENVVGIRLPRLESICFRVVDYSLIAKPAWVDIFVRRLQQAVETRARVRLAEQGVEVLEHAVRRITQRVNLFERVLIPGTRRDIQRIRIFLGDNERAAVVRSKIAKARRQADRRVLEGEGLS